MSGNLKQMSLDKGLLFLMPYIALSMTFDFDCCHIAPKVFLLFPLFFSNIIDSASSRFAQTKLCVGVYHNQLMEFCHHLIATFYRVLKSLKLQIHDVFSFVQSKKFLYT